MALAKIPARSLGRTGSQMVPRVLQQMLLHRWRYKYIALSQLWTYLPRKILIESNIYSLLLLVIGIYGHSGGN